MRKPICTIVGVLVLGLAAAACGPPSSEDNGSTDSKGTLGVVRHSSASPVDNSFFDAYIRRAKELNFETSSIDPTGDPDKAIAGMQTFASKRVDMMVVGIFDSTALRAGAVAAKDAGIPVATLSGGIADGIGINIDADAESAEKISKVLMDNTGGKGSILVLGYKTAPSCLAREEIMMAAIEGTELEQNLTRQEVSIPGQVESGAQFAQAFLAKHPAGDGNVVIWACFDDPAVGAITVLKQEGRKDVQVYGTNGTPAALQAVKDGYMSATAWPDVVRAADDLADRTEEFIKAGPDAAPVTIPLPFELITADNIDEFLSSHPDALKEG